MRAKCDSKSYVEHYGSKQARPQTVLDWKFWDKAARDPKMTTYLNHGAKVKMCETTPFVNSVGSQYIDARAQIEMACDSLRSQGAALSTCIGLSEGTVHQATECTQHIAKSLLKDVTNTWSTMLMRTMPFPADLFQDVHPNHQVLLFCKPHRPKCHQWRPTQSELTAEVRELQPYLIVECYLDAKYYHYDLVNLLELSNSMRRLRTCLKRSTSSLCRMRRWMSSAFPCPSMTLSRSSRLRVQNGTRTHKWSIQNRSNIISQVI